MSIKGGGFSRKSSASDKIPDSSLADIAFLLLIFFMVTTVFRTDKEQDIVWPAAEATEKIDEKRDDILNIWLTQAGEVFINDQPLTMDQVRPIVAPIYADSDRRLVVSIRSDREVPYRLIDEMQEQLKAAGVVRVVFATELEQRMTRARR
ncbi:MAG TPA: biopolymer transporter ExbD [Longimicrobiales bacterium]|nr:biopolymer transporter ExbD [Longimicrobiales bacterium]